MDQQKIKVAILEDLKDVVDLLREVINSQQDMECTCVFNSAEDAMHFLPHREVDILIVDIGLPRASGIDAIKYLSEKCPKMQFCMFTVYENDEKIFNSIQSGAKGYILKGSKKEKILESVRELYRGGSPMSPSIARRILEIFQKSQMNHISSPLPITDREREILALLSEGLLYKEIADQLSITTGTVKQHLHKIYEKLQVNNRTEAVNKFRFGK